MDNAVKSRAYSVDVLKGLIIIAIVFLHIIFSTHDDAGSPGIPIQAMYLGLMAFFLLSGYFYRPDRGFVSNMKKRVNQLFIALAVCSVILPILLYAWLAVLGQAQGLDDYILALQWGFGMNEVFMPLGSPKVYPLCGSAVGYYFLWAMLIAFIILYALADHIVKDNKRLAVTIIALLIIAALIAEFGRYRLPFFAELAPLAAAFMFAGAGLAKFGLVEKIEEFSWKDGRYWLPLVASLAIAAVMLFIFPPGINFDILILGQYGGLSTFPYFIESICMFVVFLYLCNLLSKIPGLVILLTECGKHTLGILLYHGFVASFIMAVICPLTDQSWFPADLTLMQRLPIAFATLIICYVICRFGPVLIGKIKAKKDKGSPESS
jgi:fucose 4-O-acetylase-like acetyltransferase